MKRFYQFSLRLILFIFIVLLLMAYLIKRPLLFVSKGEYIPHNLQQLRDDVKILSEDFIPRDAAHPENLMLVAEFIEARFKQWSHKVERQTFKINDREYANVIAHFGPDSDEIIIVGAHYDAFESYPGADDNASGVAGLLAIAQLLHNQQPESQVILVAYTTEEPPHFATHNMGSYQHAHSLQSKTVRLMISLEMIGYFSEEPSSQRFPINALGYLYPDTGNYIAIVGELFSGEASHLKKTIIESTGLNTYSINGPASIPGVDFSDHRNYWNFGYPAVMVTDTAFYRNQNYHTGADTYDKLNYEAMSKVAYGVYQHLLLLAKQ